MRIYRFKKICNKINFWNNLCILILIASVGIYAIVSYQNYIIELSDYSMKEQVNDIVHLVELERISIQEQVDMSLKIANNYFYSVGKPKESKAKKINYTAINQITKEEHKVSVNQWTISNIVIQNNTFLVDKIKEKSVETATIFQKIPQGYLRISTNVVDDKGQRAVGTFIPNDSPVVKTIEAGKTYRGRAFVVNKWYYTAYEPIYLNGKIKGILYVGVPDVLLSDLRVLLEEKEYYKNGYPYIIDKNGTFLIHPKKEGFNIKDYDFFKEMDSNVNHPVKQKYVWEKKKKYQYYEYYKPLEAFIVVTIYHDDLYEASNQIRFFAILISIIGIVLCIIITRKIIDSVINSLKKGINITQGIAEGKLNKQIDDARTRDEVHDFIKSLQKMHSRLNKIVGGIREGAEGVADASNQISSDAEYLAQGATEQAANVEEVSATVEEINANILNMSTNSNSTKQYTNETKVDLETINEASKNSMESVNKIAEKINVISEIAIKTNILALNAAIEAACAGEQGKGFGIVAKEVRKLAEMTNLAAKEIVQLVKESTEHSKRSFQLLTEIQPKMDEVNNMVNEISVSSGEQKLAIGQITEAISQLNTVTQSNASSSEQLAGNAESLNTLANNLTEMVAFFVTMQDINGQGSSSEDVEGKLLIETSLASKLN